MLRIVLVLQVLILIMFGYFIVNIQSTVNELTIQLDSALLVVEDMKTVLPEIEEAVDNFNQLKPLFENLGKLSEFKKVFDKLNIKFTEIDIDFDKEGFEIAKKIQNQNPRIPTIVFEDGSFLVEPTDVELTDKLNSL